MSFISFMVALQQVCVLLLSASPQVPGEANAQSSLTRGELKRVLYSLGDRLAADTLNRVRRRHSLLPKKHGRSITVISECPRRRCPAPLCLQHKRVLAHNASKQGTVSSNPHQEKDNETGCFWEQEG